MTPFEAIRKHCINCSGFSYKNVRLCVCDTCTLWPYRFGVRPETAMKLHGAWVMEPKLVLQLASVESSVDCGDVGGDSSIIDEWNGVVMGGEF